jgi:hypothetical protein
VRFRLGEVCDDLQELAKCRCRGLTSCRSETHLPYSFSEAHSGQYCSTVRGVTMCDKLKNDVMHAKRINSRDGLAWYDISSFGFHRIETPYSILHNDSPIVRRSANQSSSLF